MHLRQELPDDAVSDDQSCVRIDNSLLIIGDYEKREPGLGSHARLEAQLPLPVLVLAARDPLDVRSVATIAVPQAVELESEKRPPAGGGQDEINGGLVKKAELSRI